MKYTNKHNLPSSLCKAVERDNYSPGSSDVTVSELTKPVKAAVLSRIHSDEIERDVSDMIFALMGKAVHHVLEVSDTELTEQRLYYEFCKPDTYPDPDPVFVKLGGQFDRFVLKDGVLQDYKVASVWSRIFESFDDWKKQLNAYAFLLNENGYQVKRLQIVALYRDWSATKAERDSNFPQTQVELIDIELMPNDIEYFYLRDQVQVFMAGMENPMELPDCTSDDMWEKPTKYALMKEGRKSAIKVSDSMNEVIQKAEELGSDWDYETNKLKPPFYISVRPGARPRCEKYCDGAPWCDQWSDFQMTTQGENDE